MSTASVLGTLAAPWLLAGLVGVRVVGLTGGIGSGKSTVARVLACDASVDVIDFDMLAREVVEPGRAAHRAIRRRFGDEFFAADGTLNRSKLGALVFRDAAKRAELNRCTRLPIVVLALKRMLRGIWNRKIVVFDCPLLFESKLHWLCSESAVVDVSEEAQLERLQRRDGDARDLVLAKIRAQMSVGEKRARADSLIDNNGSIPELEERARAWLERQKREFARGRPTRPAFLLAWGWPLWLTFYLVA